MCSSDLRFSENVVVTGTPTLQVNAGTRTATFHSGRDGASRVAPTATYSLGTDSDPAATVGASGAAAAP